MAKTKSSGNTVRTEVMTKEVRIPIDPEDVEKKEIASAKLQLKIRKIQADIRPQVQKITQHRSEHRKLLEDIELGSELRKAKVYEVKDFSKGTATVYLAETDQKIDTRTLEKSEYTVDLTEKDEPATAEA